MGYCHRDRKQRLDGGGQVPAKIQFYLPKQCKYPLVESTRNVHMITDSINQLALCNCSQRQPQTSSNSDP